MGLDATQEWIDLVFIESLLNSTPDTDSGYADYTFLSVDLLSGNTYDITLSAAMPLAHMLSWKAWIDFNRDGDFFDASEEIVSYQSSQIGWETSTFTVPASAVTGQTIMRVSVKNGSPAQTPCEIFSLGEVEDYTVNLGSLTGISGDAAMSPEFTAYSGPGTGIISVHASNLKGQKYQMQVSDVTGRVIYNSEIVPDAGIVTKNISVPNLVDGIYFVRLMREQESLISRFVTGN
jgi:hypothetical protein